MSESRNIGDEVRLMPRPVVVGRKGQITIPSEIRKAAGIEEGDPVEVELTSEGVLLKPRKMIDPSQAWFWTPEWQAKEREADAEGEAGLGYYFDSAEEFLQALKEWSSEPDADV